MMPSTAAMRFSGLALALLWTANAGAATFRDCATCPELVSLAAGSFVMGDEDWADASPLRVVALPAFAIGRYEVTHAEWRAVMGDNPSKAATCGESCPVENVSWNDVQLYLQRLSRATGQTYRLPSEAEWEYACRAGQRTRLCGGDDAAKVASLGRAGASSFPVGQKAPNAWGLYDMSGNVWEWTQDCSHPDFHGAPADGSAWQEPDCPSRVLRGGSWFARAALRMGMAPAFRAGDFGFRVARDLIGR